MKGEDSMNGNILVTGATGFVGTEVAARLLSETESVIYVMVRARDMDHATMRLKAAWKDQKALYDSIGKRVIPVIGDFEKADLGMPKAKAQQLAAQIGIIIHSGADVAVMKSRKELMESNRNGTGNLLRFARYIQKHHHFERFIQISTAYVAGTKTGFIMEEGEAAERFSGYYEESKAAAEALVRKAGLPYSICRPGMIIGSTVDGHIRSFNTIYYVMKLILTGKLPVLPIARDHKLNVIPVDYVAEAVVKISDDPKAEGKTFHLTTPQSLCPTAGDLIDALKAWAEKNLGYKVGPIQFLPVPALKKAGLSYNKQKDAKKKGLTSNLLALMPYFFDDHIFDRTNTDALVGAYTKDWKDYIDVIMAYACSKNFMKQTEDTVFEQAMKRRESKAYPVTYYDVKADAIVPMSGPEMNRKILKIAGALQANGVVPGMKIAMTGINCTDYIALDMAIGLCGAVSVPIYYTAPVDEINLLLEKSGASWFFIGDTRIMKQASGLKTSAKTVTFGVADGIYEEGILSWSDFTGVGDEPYTPVSVDPNALATIRYTSGTTGEPKGVMFSFKQLQWMGEVLTNLLSWKERNTMMRYLSFLPQSHVVEGILASYAPYYMLCKVELYYLNDFGALTEALPKVRPTVFFSVPRFYEKVWQQLTENQFGQQWLSMEDGIQKTILGQVVKRVILKKAGLDACGQLIVGSAPVSEELLLSYRKLGIEVHNAYGQTEAPLITINRNGDNIIPTIGTPLPETEVEIAEDGELIVRGPQVALGYYGLDTDTIRDGVLKTGDLGTMEERAHIRLIGRKKEMIVTSYGKNINCSKIEERLKNIPEVSEAVLIGENRPYCTALVWLEGADSLSQEKIKAMNEKLSHPETIRKWTVIEKPLSIADGELTPNLKVRRGVVEDHYREAIEKMYE